VKIDVRRIPPEGLTLLEDFSPGELDLNTDVVSFHGPVKVRADVSVITNAVTVRLEVRAVMRLNCGRCLKDFSLDFEKDFELNYPADDTGPVIDLDPDIREEIILDYPLKPLCVQSCKGLCPKCGKNLNEGGCNCGST
jgi:uncharacterized protein